MKSHILVTIDEELVRELDRISKQDRLSLNVLETAAKEYVQKRDGAQIVTSPGSFAGTFSRKQTYAKI